MHVFYFLAITCVTLGSPMNGNNNCGELSNLEITCNFTCDKGFNLTGSPTSKCKNYDGTIHGNWSNSRPTCEGT